MLSKIKRLYQRFFLLKEIELYIKLNKKRFCSDEAEKSNVILVDFLDSYPLNETYGYIVNNLAKKKRASIKYFKFDYDKYDLWTCFFNRKTQKIYESFNAKPGFSYRLRYILSSLYEAYHIFKKLNTKSDIVDINLYEICVGDLIYDTYLRRFNQKTINIKSLKLYFIIFQAHIILKSIQNYFSKNNVKAVLPGDVAYIFSGLIAKYAIKQNINVYSLIETDGFLITKLEDVNYYRRMPYWKYPQIFSKYSESVQKEKIALARKALENRLNGGVDTTLSYMGNSSFHQSEVDLSILCSEAEIKILIPLHDFFDSPHIYRDMIFPDFWEWITITLDYAKQTGFEWYVKPHPNALPQNEQIVDELKTLYKDAKNIIFIESSISNRQIIASGINAVFTVYGSVGHEFAYMGIPVVNAGDNPHISYNFNLHPKNFEEYIYWVKNANELKLNMNQEDIASFFYMHYLYYQPLKYLNPVYPPTDYIESNRLGKETSKNKRIFYHKSIQTINYFIGNYSQEQDNEINRYLDKVL